MFQGSKEFQSEVSVVINPETAEVALNIYEMISAILVKYVGRVSPEGVRSFITFIVTLFGIIIPFIEIHMSNKSEERLKLEINEVRKEVQDLKESEKAFHDETNQNNENQKAKLDSLSEKIEIVKNVKGSQQKGN